MLTSAKDEDMSLVSPTKNLSQKARPGAQGERKLSHAYRLLATAALAGCSFLVAPGCGRQQTEFPTAPVSGRVLLDGEPLQFGVVRFVPVVSQEGRKTIVELKDGSFALPKTHGPTVGKHRVEIEARDTGGYALDDETAIEQLKEKRVRRIRVIKIPSRYNSRSRLEVTVSDQDPNNFLFELTSK